MSRSTPFLFSLLVIAACSGRVEQLVLRGYFDLCAAADDVALANVALVTLDPKRDGVVGHFRLTRLAPEIARPASSNARVAALSLSEPDASRVAGATLVTRDVDVAADIHRNGEVRAQVMTITLARAQTASAKGRWIVVRLVLDGRTLPEASSGRP